MPDLEVWVMPVIVSGPMVVSYHLDHRHKCLVAW
jgi:hypothetical protein